MKNEILDLEILLTQVEQYNEKAEVAIDDLEQEYFSLDDEKYISFYHENARIRCCIVQDYIHFMKKTLSSMNEIIQKVAKSNKNN